MSRQRTSGFTLIELLVVISIIALLISLLLPALGSARMRAQVSKDAAQLKGIGTSLFTYASDNVGYGPVESGVDDGGGGYTSVDPQHPHTVLAGTDGIYGTNRRQAQLFNPDIAGPQALGALVPQGALANPNPAATFGDYMKLEMLWGPRAAETRGEHGLFLTTKYYEYFGAPSTQTGINGGPDGCWWGSYPFFMRGSYAYRMGNWSKWNGLSGNVANNWTPNYKFRNLHTDQVDFNNRTWVMDSGNSNYAGWGGSGGPQFASMGGGNTLRGDGSVRWWKSPQYSREWSRNELTCPSGHGNTNAFFAAVDADTSPYYEAHHWIQRNLIFSIADADLYDK